MAFKFIGTLICFISVSSFEIKDDFEVVDQQHALFGILLDSFDFEVVYGLQDESVLNSFGLRRKLLADSDSNEVLNEDELKEDEFVLRSAGLRRNLSSDSDDHHYFWWLFCFFVFIFCSKCLWSYIKDLNEIQLDTLVVSNSIV